MNLVQFILNKKKSNLIDNGINVRLLQILENSIRKIRFKKNFIGLFLFKITILGFERDLFYSCKTLKLFLYGRESSAFRLYDLYDKNLVTNLRTSSRGKSFQRKFLLQQMQALNKLIGTIRCQYRLYNRNDSVASFFRFKNTQMNSAF